VVAALGLYDLINGGGSRSRSFRVRACIGPSCSSVSAPLAAVFDVVPVPPAPTAAPPGPSGPVSAPVSQVAGPALPTAFSTCENSLPSSIRISGWNTSTQCQQISGGGIGIAAVLERGVIDAVDVWGWIENGIEVCLRGQGAMLFLDAAAMPRTVSELPAYSVGDMTCPPLEGPGSVVLVHGPAAPAKAASGQALSGCMVRANYILNLRAGPGGDIMDVVPYDAVLTAVEYSPGWYKVDFNGQHGWLSADYVSPQGDC